ncbi:MAG: glycoside hydrolase family 15 protein, partial [Anaerolineae bacterium]
RKGGRFRIGPAGSYQHDQAYLPDSNVLVTMFNSKGGSATVTDFMPLCDDVTTCDHELVRLVRCQQGRVDVKLEFQPRLNYANGRTDVRVTEGAALARQGKDCLSLSSGVPLAASGDGAAARWRLREGEWTAFVLRWQEDSPPAIRDYDVYGKLGRTQAFWRFVTRDWRYLGRWEDVVKRSMLALHLLLYVPTGAVCAAVTTSLPERIGGERNWDYRFSWLRDAAFTMDIFNRLGHTTYTLPFIQWLANFCLSCDEEVNSLYSIGAEADPGTVEEVVLEHLEGYKGSRPVRVGNQAFRQLQLDIYGEVLLSFDSYQRAGGVIDDTLWALAESLVEAAIRNWQKPDNSIWEVRSAPRHFTYSKLMCWVAVDRGLRLARAQKRPVDYDRWRRTRSAMRQDILDKAWNPDRGAFVQSYGARNLDASVVFMPMVGFLPGDDPRIASTIERVQQELTVNGFVHRYRTSETDDGLAGDEGTFTMCSLWLVGALVAGGRLQEAKALFEKVVGLRNHVGLYSEMIDPASGEFLGNYPQAFTHIALIHTARNLDRALNKVELGKIVAA